MNYTGGTTGRAKGTVRRHRGVVALTASVLADFEFPREPQFLAAGPISHVTGSNVLPTLIRGGCVRLLAKFDPDEVCRRIDKDRINATLLVPTMIYALLDCESVRTANLGSLGLLLYGASAMSPARLAEGIDRLGPVFAQLYGQTECHPITYLPRRDHDLGDASALGSCGYASTSCDVRLLDDEGQPVEDGSVGEICVRSPACIDGYWNRPQETAEAFKFGWLHTGDLGVRDHRGRFSIVDRKKDMIVTGGFNVYPKEIEDVLTSLSGVAAAAVVGLPDPKWGEAVTAFVVAKPGAELAAPELLEQIRAAKGSMLTPKRIEFVDALPLTPVGKVDKRALRRLPPSLPIASGAIAGSRSERA
jgi:fatty-acyl-CoA synthase